MTSSWVGVNDFEERLCTRLSALLLLFVLTFSIVDLRLDIFSASECFFSSRFNIAKCLIFSFSSRKCSLVSTSERYWSSWWMRVFNLRRRLWQSVMMTRAIFDYIALQPCDELQHQFESSTCCLQCNSISHRYNYSPRITNFPQYSVDLIGGYKQKPRGWLECGIS